VTGALARISTVSNGPESNELASKILERLPLNEDFSEWRTILLSVEFFIYNGNQKVSFMMIMNQSDLLTVSIWLFFYLSRSLLYSFWYQNKSSSISRIDPLFTFDYELIKLFNSGDIKVARIAAGMSSVSFKSEHQYRYWKTNFDQNWWFYEESSRNWCSFIWKIERIRTTIRLGKIRKICNVIIKWQKTNWTYQYVMYFYSWILTASANRIRVEIESWNDSFNMTHSRLLNGRCLKTVITNNKSCLKI